MTTQLLRVIDKCTEILDQGGAVDAVYLDFAKAFNTVPHMRWMTKLEIYGVSSKLLEWIRQFLIGRKQRVGNVVWYPFLKQDIELLEGVQHRANRMVPGLAKFPYEERLRKMDLPSLAYRRTRS